MSRLGSLYLSTLYRPQDFNTSSTNNQWKQRICTLYHPSAKHWDPGFNARNYFFIPENENSTLRFLAWSSSYLEFLESSFT